MDLLTCMPGETADEVLANNVALWILNEDFTVLDCTEMATRMFGYAGQKGRHFADIFDNSLAWEFSPWVTSETQVDFLVEIFNRARKVGQCSRHIHLICANRMMYPAILTVFLDQNGRFLVRVCPFDPYTGGFETGTVMLQKDGTLGGHDGNYVTIEELQMLRDYARVDSIDELAEEYGMTKRQAGFKIQRVCEKYNCKNITELMKMFMKRHLDRVPSPQNVMKTDMHFQHHDRIRHKELPAHRLPSMAMTPPEDETSRDFIERQRSKFLGH
jgi:hypothetical protein